MLKKIISSVLTVCIMISMISVSFVSASASAGAFFGEKAVEKLVEIGMRGLAEGTEALGKATGNEEAEKVFSFIANWVFSDGAEAAAKKTQELCEEILERLDEIEESMNESFSVVESMLGIDAADTAKTNLDNKWDQDVEGIIKSYDAERSLELYLQYMESAVNYSNQGLSGQELQDAVQPDENNLIMSFANMYNGSIPIEDNTTEGVKKYIFEDTSINSKFENMISSLANNLVKSNSTSIAEYAAQFAYETYPFSHQQYTYIYTVMEKQLTEIQNVEMLYNEYLYQQGKYLEETYGEDSTKYAGYLNSQSSFYNLMNTENIGVNSKIVDMLEYEMTVDAAQNIKMTLNDYMKPEDAVNTVLQVDGFKELASYSDNLFHAYIEFTTDKMKFNRVMANGTIYYIIDPNQFSYEYAMTLNALDCKEDVPANPDTHWPSPDYLNLIKSMSDGVNTFRCTSDTEKYVDLFNTNAFRVRGSIPADYLEEYFPVKGTKETYIITPSYKNNTAPSLFRTLYEKFYFINASEPQTGNEPTITEISGELAQSDKDGYERKYSVILANENDTYNQTAHLQTKGEGFDDVQIVSEDSNITVNNGKSVVIPSGEMLTIKFKLKDGAEFKSLKCVRNNDVITNRETKTETVLVDDIELITPDDDGYYTFSYPMPYSDATFMLESYRHNFDDNGFCTSCGAYQSATLNSNGVYEISNAGQLFWFASLVNGDSTHADFDAKDQTAKAVLTKNINLESREWASIMSFNGTFDGQNNTISNLKITKTSSYSGLFGSSAGTIKNLTVKGEITLSSNGSHIGGVVGYADGATISNVASYVNISNTGGELKHVGGVIGSMETKETFADKCVYYGTINVKNSVDCIGGVIAYTDSGGRISNCANLGTVTASAQGANTGGILGYVNNSAPTVKNCYNYGTVSNGDSTNRCGAVIGWARDYSSANITNNYYLEGSSSLAFGSESISGASATSKTADGFKSGEVAYLLNSKVTNGTQAWYQNIDNGETPDAYPVFDGGTVYCGYTTCIKEENVYSNNSLITEPIAHKFDDNGFCTVCGAYQPATLNSDGVYEISNAGQLFWFASLVNGDTAHADFDKQISSANAVLTADIDLENREWTPIGNYGYNKIVYKGKFDGQNYVISGLNVTKSYGYLGLFGRISGTLENFTVKGDIKVNTVLGNVGGVVGAASGATISNVSSYVNISREVGNSNFDFGGVVGSCLDKCTIKKCSNYGNVSGTDDVGGVVGYFYGTIENCYNIGNISGNYQCGGIVGATRNIDLHAEDVSTVKNCYNVGTITCGSSAGAIVGYDGLNKFSNCYYINSCGSSDSRGTSKTAEQFSSGEVAYRLNNSVTSGKQVWYQNIDNGETPDAYPVFDGGTVYCGFTCSSKEEQIYSNKRLSVEPVAHRFDTKGFCTVCGEYQPAVLNSDGVYEISNAGQLYWFASLVNGDSTHAEFEEQDQTAKAVLTKDIDLESREWTPIISFNGTFDGQNHTISNLKITETSSCCGLFGSSAGTIKNFTVKGEITLSSDGSHIGGVVGYADGATISNVASYVNISNTDGELKHVGGVIGSMETRETFADKCVYYGTINVKNSTDCIGGVIAYTNSGGHISNCANLGTVTASAEGAYTGGILGYVNNSKPTVKNCYNYGTVSNGDSTNYCGALIGWARNYSSDNIANNYYLEGSSALAFGSDSKSGVTGVSKTAEEFASGEVAYLLNNSVTDGTQVWYQNIDNDETPDAYPVFEGGTVYCGYVCNKEEKTYSNYPLSAEPTAHKFDDDGFCTVCGAYQPAALNSDGVYEISNAGQLYWFAALVNGDRTHADFDSKNGAANAVLVKDIVVNNGDMSELANTQADTLRKWTPIGTSDNSYTGKFDGQRHTISGLYYSNKNANNVGLFGYTRGGANVYNVGVINSYIEGRNCVGAIIGRNNNTGVNVQRSFSEATVIGNEGVAGIVGSTYGGKIIDCYNAGSVTGYKYVGSIRGKNTNNSTSTGAMNNCFNVGEVIGTGDSNIGGIRGDGDGTISNCYCISTQLTDTKATTKTPEQFASGEVAYLLNSSVTDGSQVWYQNIDNGETPDAYPVFDGGTVYYLSYKDAYSNTYSEAPAEPDEFDKDDDGNLIIKTYDDLVELSQLIRSDYDVYGSQSYILENNILAPSDSEWTQGIGSVSENKPFNGTFDGNGYCIMGLNVNSAEYGGLFEIIGESGYVKDLLVFDCDFSSSSETAGGIAAINNGTIDHCVSGVNLTSGTLYLHGKEIDAAALNSSVKGEISGGIVGENNGLITGCRNASIVSGTQCGGVAGVNTGKIYGCANNAVIGKSNSSVSGGLVGKNGGTIESSYNSGRVNAESENSKGSIAGINGYDGTEPTVKNVFYRTESGLDAVGTDSVQIPDDTNTGMSDISDFWSSSFVDQLNAVSDDTVVWVHNSHQNKGCPTIKGNFLELYVKSAGNNITVKGSMHRDLNVSYDICSEGDSVYKLISSSIGENKILKAYSLNLTDKDGNYIPAELWCQEYFEISVPVDNENVQFVGIDADGQVIYYEPDSVENGIAVFTVSHPMSFAIVETTTKSVSSDDNNGAIKTPSDSTPIQTGSTMCVAVLLIAVFSLVVIFSVKRRNRIG